MKDFNIQYLTRNIQRRLYVVLVAFWLCAVLVPVSWGQVAPDLTVSQTQGVDESKYFFLGPTGMKGWMYWYHLTSLANQILVTEVRAGTPADGVMQYHDVILGIGGNSFTNDARTAFVDAITAAEGGDGQLNLTVFRPSEGSTTTKMIQLAITNTPLSATTPYNCPKANRIFDDFCNYILDNDSPLGDPTKELSLWAMMASTNAAHVSWATNYIKSQAYASQTNLSIYIGTTQKNWNMSYGLVTLAQYYLLTGDTDVLPAMTNRAVFIAQGQDRMGQWGHTYAYPKNNGGMLHGTLPGYGAVNAAGMISLYGLVLARKCGVNNQEVDDAIEKSSSFFRANVGLGLINYGFHEPVEGSVDNNGIMGFAAHVFRALGDWEAAKWFAMMNSTYKWRDWGHTGNEFNHAWGPSGANVGGPDLVKFVHSERDVQGPYYQVSLTMRRQPEGKFQSQGQEGRGSGRNNGHATGGYALQLAASRTNTIEMLGKDYGTNCWLTTEEMEQVRFGHRYEANKAGLTALDTATLVTNLWHYAPKIVGYVADALTLRLTEGTLTNDLMAIVVDTNVLDTARVGALRTLDEDSRLAVKATTDAWYAPSSGYVLNWGARRYAAKDKDSQIKILEAIVAFDQTVPFDMLTVGAYSASVYTMSTNGFSQAEMDKYYDAVAVILAPGTGSVGWFVDAQQIRNWPPSLIARFADGILKVGETYALDYDAPSILATPPIGEGLYTWMVRSGYMPSGPSLDMTSVWLNYGQKGMIYSNYIRRLKPVNFNYKTYINADRFLDLEAPARNPTLYWFRDLIRDNINNDYTNAATIEQLRFTMQQLEGQYLAQAVTLDLIAKHGSNADPVADIAPYVGFISPVVGTAWRRSLGAVELGATYGTDQNWVDQLTDAVSSNDHQRIGGSLHVLARRNVDARAQIVTDSLLHHENDFVIVAALDVYRAVGTESDLLMLFNDFMTNCYIVSDGEVIYDDPYKLQAYWDAITGIIERDGSIAPATANQLAAAFNARTSNGTDMTGIPDEGTPRPVPLSTLSPATSTPDQVYAKYLISPIGILGLFPGTDCDQALLNIQGLAEESYWDRHHKYASGEASMLQHTIPEIVAAEVAGGTNRWSNRAARLHLMSELLLDQVAVSNQIGVLKDFRYKNIPMQESGGWEYTDFQYQLNRRRGLEETNAVHFFYMK